MKGNFRLNDYDNIGTGWVTRPAWLVAASCRRAALDKAFRALLIEE